MMAKLYACDDLAGVACAGLWDATCRNCHFGACVIVVVELAWDGRPEKVRVLYVKLWLHVLLCSRVAAGSWNLL